MYKPAHRIFLFFLIACFYNCDSIPPNRTTPPKDTIRILFYNVENLFDTIDDTANKNDNDFLPTSWKRWTPERYYKKLEHIAKVILTLDDSIMPVIIGLAEVENRSVLKDLLSKTGLSSYNYAIIHEESPDHRGIDVALIYNADYFQPILHDTIRINFPSKPDLDSTRNILYVQGLLNKTDTLHLFVNHWPSRSKRQLPAIQCRGTTKAGQRCKKKTKNENQFCGTHQYQVGGGIKPVSEKLRIQAAKVLRRFIDSLSLVYHQPKIIVMGDFNDEPSDRSITKLLLSDLMPRELYNPFYNKSEFRNFTFEGTYYYRKKDRWYLLDHLMLSLSLLDSTATIYFKPGNAKIFKPDWLLHKSIPFPTYQGPKYIGGYSDHLPVYIDLIN